MPSETLVISLSKETWVQDILWTMSKIKGLSMNTVTKSSRLVSVSDFPCFILNSGEFLHPDSI